LNNLLQDMLDARQRGEWEKETGIREELQTRATYKHLSYFHDCLPGCVPHSLVVADHQALPGRPTPTCRILYRPHLAFMEAGRTHRERLFMAANRCGKTDAASFEVRNHLTGLYPPWWRGRRFSHPTEWWAAGDTRLTTRDILQLALLGPHTDVATQRWSGMIDPHLVAKVVRASGGVANCLDTVYVEHCEKHHGAPALSELAFKSYDQGRRNFQGTSKHGIWLDEEPPDGGDAAEAEAQGSSDIWTECLLRTMTTEGIVIATFTPLRGLTPFIKQYLETAVMRNSEGAEVDAKKHFYPKQRGAAHAG